MLHLMHFKFRFLVFLWVFAAGGAQLHAAPETPAIIPLWVKGAPGALGERPQDQPTLTAYLPEPAKRNGASMLILRRRWLRQPRGL